jgi:hypothetical protein
MTIFNKYFYSIALFLIKNPKIKKFILLAFITTIYLLFFCTNDIYCFDDSPAREINNIHELEGNNHHTYELEGNKNNIRHMPNPSHYPRDNSTMLGTIHSNPSYELGEINNNRNGSNSKNYN